MFRIKDVRQIHLRERKKNRIIKWFEVKTVKKLKSRGCTARTEPLLFCAAELCYNIFTVDRIDKILIYPKQSTQYREEESMKKRWLAILLAITLFMSMSSMAFAAEEADTSDEFTYEEDQYEEDQYEEAEQYEDEEEYDALNEEDPAESDEDTTDENDATDAADDTAASAAASFTVLKIDPEGNGLADAEFTLYADAGLNDRVTSKTSDDKGIAAFTDIPEGTYYLKETSAPKGYIAVDESIPVTITAREAESDQEGTDTTASVSFDTSVSDQVDVSQQPNEVVVKNQKAVEVELTGQKKFTNGKLSNEQFSFTVKDEEGTVVATAKNDQKGNLVFDKKLTFIDAGIYTYTVEEDLPGEATKENDYTAEEVKYDTSKKTVVIEVKDEDGKLTGGIVSEKSDEISFTNTAITQEKPTPEPATKTLTGKKIFENGKLKDGQFTFIATDQYGHTTHGSVDKDGDIKFNTITYKEADTYTYTVREERPRKATKENKYTVDNIQYDVSEKTVVVNVTDNNGTLVAQVDEAKSDQIIFKNVYTAQSRQFGVKTGDTANPLLWAVIAVAAAAVIAGVVIVNRKRK